jgi:hypothetical protein
MRFAQYEALVKKHGGYLEQTGRDDWVARFPSVEVMRNFNREIANVEAA